MKTAKIPHEIEEIQEKNAVIGKKALFIFLGVVIIVLSLIAIANYHLDSMVYKESHKALVAAVLETGKNYSIYDPNIDMRGLRREHLNITQQPVEVMISGGSRWQVASSEMFLGKTFYNAHIHSDMLEDMFAIAELLTENDILPDMLIMSVRYMTFSPVEKKNSALWLNFVPEYRKMANRLNVDTHSWVDTLQVKRWFDLLSVKGLWNQINYRISNTHSPAPTDNYSMESLDVLGADGSLRWSTKHQKEFNVDYALNDSQQRIEKNKKKKLYIDPNAVKALENLIRYLQEQNVRVVLAQTPFHPAFYEGIQGTEYMRGLEKIEAEAHRLANKFHFDAVGSFDATKLGCTADMFMDWHHANVNCLQKVTDSIPN